MNRIPQAPKTAASNGNTTLRVPRATAPRLSAQQIADLLNGYHNGQSVYDLAARFGIHRTTVSAHLHRAGIPMRRQGLNEHGLNQAIRLYQDGWSVARIGTRLGVDGGTVWTALRTQGVRMRDTHGRDR